MSERAPGTDSASRGPAWAAASCQRAAERAVRAGARRRLWGGRPQALYPARAGHDVTGIDTSGELLAGLQDALSAEPAEVTGRSGSSAGPEKGRPSWVAGTFDLVLCHVAAMYLGDITPMLTALARVTAPGGAMSLLVRDGLTTAMRDGLRGDWAAALAAFDAKDCQVGANVRTMDKQFRHQARLHKAQTGGG